MHQEPCRRGDGVRGNLWRSGWPAYKPEKDLIPLCQARNPCSVELVVRLIIGPEEPNSVIEGRNQKFFSKISGLEQ